MAENLIVGKWLRGLSQSFLGLSLPRWQRSQQEKLILVPSSSRLLPLSNNLMLGEYAFGMRLADNSNLVPGRIRLSRWSPPLLSGKNLPSRQM
jgi:hypothetical protein